MRIVHSGVVPSNPRGYSHPSPCLRVLCLWLGVVVPIRYGLSSSWVSSSCSHRFVLRTIWAARSYRSIFTQIPNYTIQVPENQFQSCHGYLARRYKHLRHNICRYGCVPLSVHVFLWQSWIFSVFHFRNWCSFFFFLLLIRSCPHRNVYFGARW